MAARNATSRGAVSRGALAPFYNPPSITAGLANAVQIGEYFVLRLAVAVAVPAAPDEIAIYTPTSAPFRFSIIRCWANILTAVGASTWRLYPLTASAGTLYAQVSSGATGYSEMTGAITASSSVLPGTRGLYLVRSDDRTAGELFVMGMVMGA